MRPYQRERAPGGGQLPPNHPNAGMSGTGYPSGPNMPVPHPKPMPGSSGPPNMRPQGPGIPRPSMPPQQQGNMQQPQHPSMPNSSVAHPGGPQGPPQITNRIPSGPPGSRPKPLPGISGSKIAAGRAAQGRNAAIQSFQGQLPGTALSGSETDVSTSTENLTQEERFLLRHMERQDPQGEENGDPAFAHVPRLGPGPPHHSQLSTSSRDSNSSNPKQPQQVSMSVSSSLPQSSAAPTGSLHQGPMKAKDAHQIKLQQLQSQQQQLLIAAAAVASSATSSGTASIPTTGIGMSVANTTGRLATPTTTSNIFAAAGGGGPSSMKTVVGDNNIGSDTNQIVQQSAVVTNANAVYPRSYQEDMYNTNSSRIKAMVAAANINNASVSGLIPQSNYSAFNSSAVQPPPPAMSPSLSSANSILHPTSNVSHADMQSSLSAKLNPSVYSHPNVQDPVLMAPKSYRDHHQFPIHRDLAVLSGKRSNVEMTSSGAFFDPRSISKKSMDGLTDPRLNLPASIGGAQQSDIIAQLTREMKLQQGSNTASGLLSGSSDANISSSSSGLGSSSHLNQLMTSQIPHSGISTNSISSALSTSLNTVATNSVSQQILSQMQQDANKLSKLSSGDTHNNLSTTAISSIMTHSAGSSGYKSGGLSGGTISGGDHSSDNSFSDLTGVGKAIQKSISTTGIIPPPVASRLPISSNTSLLLSNNSSVTSLNAPGSGGIHTSSLLIGSAGTPSMATTGLTSFTSSLLQQQQQLESSIAALSTTNVAAGGIGGTVSRLISDDKKLAPEKLSLLSRSQPDLFTGIDATGAISNLEGAISPQSPSISNLLAASSATELGKNLSSVSPIYANSGSTPQLLQQIEQLRIENHELKSNNHEILKKVAKVSILEQEMSKIHQAYQALLKHSEKRELLEKSARSKLQAVILSLSEANKEVTERHEAVMSQLMSGEPRNQNIPGLDTILRGEIMRKDTLIAQLMNQNKMLMAAKERQDLEITSQGETLEEQRSHIQILDNALSNAQATILRLEEENRMKEGYAERVKQMTRSLEQLQAASEKREAMEKKLRIKLEDELKELRAQQQGEEQGAQRRFPQSSETLEELRRKFAEAEERIIRLESERTQWEQRYLEESAMRQVAIDAASIPKDAKIAALEKNSAESEKMIAEARSDKIKQLEEMQGTQRKCSELENMLKNLETGLAEREAMIRILQSNKTMSNSNLAAEIVNKAASGQIVGAPTTSAGAIGAHPSSDVASSSLRSMLNQAPSSIHNLNQHHYQMSLVGTPSSSSTAILHNKTLSHLAADSRSLLQTSTPSFTSSALLLPPPPPAPLPSVATSLSMLPPSMHHSKQLSTPINLAAGNTFKSISLNSTPIRNMGSLATPQPHPNHALLHQLHNPNHPPTNPLLLGRSMTPSADMLLLRSSATPIAAGNTTSDLLRSMTPGPADLHRSTALSSIGNVTNQLDQLTLKTAALRRESAPAGVFVRESTAASHPVASIGPNFGNNLINPAELIGNSLHSTSAAVSGLSPAYLRENMGKSGVTGGGTMPKMSMSLLRENTNRNSITNKFGSPGNSNISMSSAGMIGQTQVPGIVSSGSGLNTSNAFNSYIDDSIGSFMGSLTPTRIDSSPAHGQRLDNSLKPVENPESFMEVWRV